MEGETETKTKKSGPVVRFANTLEAPASSHSFPGPAISSKTGEPPNMPTPSSPLNHLPGPNVPKLDKKITSPAATRSKVRRDMLVMIAKEKSAKARNNNNDDDDDDDDEE